MQNTFFESAQNPFAAQQQQQTIQQLDQQPQLASVTEIVERQNIMATRNTGFNAESLRTRCFDRLRQQRQAEIKLRRSTQNPNQFTTESKVTKAIENQVDNDILQDQSVLRDLVENEIKAAQAESQQALSEMDVEEMNQVYHEITQELYQAVAQQLLQLNKQDEAYSYESNEAFSRQAAEAQAMAYDQNNKDCYVCAICKQVNAHRVKTKLMCENTGCLDIDLKIDQFSVEHVMQQIDFKMQEHKTQYNQIAFSKELANSEMKQVPACGGITTPSHISVGSMELDVEDGTPGFGDASMGQKSDIVIFISCSDCNFLDFTDTVYQ